MSDDKKQVSSLIGYTPPEDAIGERIKTKRGELDLNIEELARLTQQYDCVEPRSGVAASTIHRYENNKFKPGTREIRLLCEALEVSADWLIRGVDHNLNQESSNLSMAAESFIQAVTLLIKEDKLPFSNMNKANADKNWKQTERQLKLEKAKTTK